MSVLALLNGAQIANGEIIDADDLKDNFNQLINLLNGTSSNKEAVTKLSDPAVAPLTLNQLNASGPVQLWQLNSVDKAKINNLAQFESLLATGTAPFVVASTTKVTNLNADLLDDLSSAAFAQLATHRTYFSCPIGFEADPTVTTLSIEDRQVWVAPPNLVEMKITRIWIKWTAGSRTAGQTLTYQLRKRNAAGGGLADIGGISLDNTNNTIHVVYYNDIGDVTLAAGDTITFYKSAIGASQTEKAVTIGFEGYQKLST
jgi:hypothetical protein